MNLFNFKRLAIGLAFLAQGCITPVNMSYDNAIPLEKNELSLAGAFSKSAESTRGSKESFVANNLMLRAGLGIDGKTTLYTSYYRKGVRSIESNDFWLEEGETFNTYDHFDIGAKFSVNKKKNIALKAMAGVYSIDNELAAFSLYNSLIFTNEFNRNVELSVILHNTAVLFATLEIYPGINLNAGFSTDKSKWVIRPEIGITTEAISAGIGAEFKFSSRKI